MKTESRAKPQSRQVKEWVFVFAALRLCVSCSAAAAADWPEWRGPGRNGLAERSPALAPTFPGSSPAWRSEPIAGGDRGGRGSPVVHAGRVYVLQAGEADEVYCLDADTGKTRWKVRLAAGGKEAGSSTPCVAGGRLYVVGSGSRVYCLDADTGKPVWEGKLPRTGRAPVASSVAVVGKAAVVLADVLTGLDVQTGDVLWTQPRVAGHESSPARWSATGREYVVCNTARETHCVDPADGKVLWSVPGGGKSTPVVAQEYGGEFLVNMSDRRDNGLSAHRLTPDGPRELWRLEASDRGASPVVCDGHVYAVAGGGNGHRARLVCAHLDTGKVAWDEVIDFAEVSSPVAADGKVFAVCGTSLLVVQATPERYGVLGRDDLRVTLCTSPAVAGGRLYLRQGDAIACYDLRAAR
jgi:outer membrane protein assembly factor BamB